MAAARSIGVLDGGDGLTHQPNGSPAFDIAKAWPVQPDNGGLLHETAA